MLRRIPTSVLKAPGRRSLVSLTSSARPTVNPNSTSQQNASTTSSSLSASAKMFEFDVKSVAGEMRKRGLTSAATRDAGMDRVSSEYLSFSEMGYALSPERSCLYRHLPFIRLSSYLICSGICTPTSAILSGLSLSLSLSCHLPAGHHRPSPLLSGISSRSRTIPPNLQLVFFLLCIRSGRKVKRRLARGQVCRFEVSPCGERVLYLIILLILPFPCATPQDRRCHPLQRVGRPRPLALLLEQARTLPCRPARCWPAVERDSGKGGCCP